MTTLGVVCHGDMGGFFYLQNIFDVASSHAKQNKPCLVACLRRLVETLESFMVCLVDFGMQTYYSVVVLHRLVLSLPSRSRTLTSLDDWMMSTYPSQEVAVPTSQPVVRSKVTPCSVPNLTSFVAVSIGMFVCFSTSRLASGENTKTPRLVSRQGLIDSTRRGHVTSRNVKFFTIA